MSLLKLFQYQTWADEKVFYFLSKISEMDRQKQHGEYATIKDRIHHIVITLDTWYERLNGFSPNSLPDYRDEPTDELISRWRELNTKLSTHYSDLEELEVTYTNTSGETFTTTAEDIAYHLINHTTFYRSQIIMMIRMLGYDVEDTDYILYQRI